jgi:hypothetical protein
VLLVAAASAVHLAVATLVAVAPPRGVVITEPRPYFVARAVHEPAIVAPLVPLAIVAAAAVSLVVSISHISSVGPGRATSACVGLCIATRNPPAPARIPPYEWLFRLVGKIPHW